MIHEILGVEKEASFRARDLALAEETISES